MRIQEAADLLGVSPATVRRWADSGRLVGQRAPSGQRRFLPEELEAAMVHASRNGEPERQPTDAERRYRLLFETSLELASSLELRELLQAAACRVGAALEIPDCDIYRLVGDDTLLCLASSVGGLLDESWAGREFPLCDWHCERLALETGCTVSVASLRDPRLGEVERRDMRRYGQHSAISLPLISRDRVIGVLDLFDHVEREFSPDEIAGAEAAAKLVALALDHAQLYDEVKRLHLGNLRALSSALSAKDYYTLGHAGRVAAYAALLGCELGWPGERLEELQNAAFLHDIGKIGVSDRVLLKAGPLTSEEWELVRQHPGISAEIVRPLFHQELVEGVRHHHERFDGEGYPDGLRGPEIPHVARLLCVVDSYDAMSCERPYRRALSYRQCLAELRRCAGAQFDPEMVEAFARVLGVPQAAPGHGRRHRERGGRPHRPCGTRPAAQPRRRSAPRVPGHGRRLTRVTRGPSRRALHYELRPGG